MFFDLRCPQTTRSAKKYLPVSKLLLSRLLSYHTVNADRNLITGKKSIYGVQWIYIHTCIADQIFTVMGSYSVCLYLKEAGPAKSRSPRNPPKFTKSSVSIKQIPCYATKSTYMKRKLSKSNVSSHEIRLPRNPVLLTKSTHSHAFK